MNKIIIWTAFFFVISLFENCQDQKSIYVCPPCELSCDSLTFDKDGICPHCKMNLIVKVDSFKVNEITLREGSGNFLIEGGIGHTEKVIKVFYHLPNKFNRNTKILIVLPGAGRNGDDYRDAWIKASEDYNVFILSPEYSQKYYPQFWSYNLAGMITDVKLNKDRTALMDFKISESPNEWIYNDFDRIFNLVKNEIDLDTDNYDMFGHSAGGQILHRLAIFKSESKVNRILASNAGWYTVPNNNVDFPVGLKNSNKYAEDIDFSTNLILFLGEKDDANETRGDLRRTPAVDKQGLHRLARGKYFYQTSKKMAGDLGKAFNWKIVIAPKVGHDFSGISKAAAIYLYESYK